jgi:hypothetical protein
LHGLQPPAAQGLHGLQGLQPAAIWISGALSAAATAVGRAATDAAKAATLIAATVFLIMKSS